MIYFFIGKCIQKQIEANVCSFVKTDNLRRHLDRCLSSRYNDLEDSLLCRAMESISLFCAVGKNFSTLSFCFSMHGVFGHRETALFCSEFNDRLSVEFFQRYSFVAKV